MLKIINPATEEIIAEKKEAAVHELHQAFALAKEAQKSWQAKPYAKRAEAIAKFRKSLEATIDECALITSQEMGKPRHQACGEIAATLKRIDWFLQYTPHHLDTVTVCVDGPMTERISFEPLGVVGNISAWNFPYFVGSNVFIPALLTGNSVLYKPSEYASLTGLKFAELMQQAGVPEGVFQTLVGGRKTGEALCELPLDGMFFTGSVPAAKSIAEATAKRFMSLGIEAGGKDPVYVCEDADLSYTVANLVDGAFYNAGQSCCSVERIYVHKAVYQPFLEAFKAQTQALVVGDPLSAGSYMGPLARAVQREVLDRQVADARSKGARLLVEGGRVAGKGYYYRPTVLENASHDMLVMQEESFGPICGIRMVTDDQEAISLMNDSQYGLTAGVHSRCRKRAERILSEMQAGTVYWNACDRVSPYLPWSGRKDSGVGSTMSELGIKAFMRPKAWHLKELS